jgi:parallel beta-helix repeat protein
MSTNPRTYQTQTAEAKAPKTNYLRIVLFLLLFASAVFFAFMHPAGRNLLTGGVIYSGDEFKTFDINQSISDAENITFNNSVVSLRITGTFTGNGSAKVYAVSGEQRILIYEFKQEDTSSESPTGFVIFEEESNATSKIQQTPIQEIPIVSEDNLTSEIMQENLSEMNETDNILTDNALSEEISNEIILNETSEIIVVETNNETLANETIETIADDMNFNTTENNTAVENIKGYTSEENISDNISINDSDINATELNTSEISTTEVNTSNINASEINATEINISSSLSTEVHVENGCLETCSISPFDVEYISFEVSSGTLFVDNISYSSPDNGFYLKENITDMNLSIGTFKIINLADYFSADNIYFDFSSSPGYSFEFSESYLKIIGVEEGEWIGKVYAVKDDVVIESNEFKINVVNPLSLELVPPLDIGAQNSTNETNVVNATEEFNLTSNLTDTNLSENNLTQILQENISIEQANVSFNFTVSPELLDLLNQNNDSNVSDSATVRIIVKYKEDSSPQPIAEYVNSILESSTDVLSNTDVLALRDYHAQISQELTVVDENISALDKKLDIFTDKSELDSKLSDKYLLNEELNFVEQDLKKVEFAEKVLSSDIEVKQSIPSTKMDSISIKINALDMLNNNSDIEAVYLDNPISLLLEDSLNTMRVPQAKEYSQNNLSKDFNGSGVKVCIIDTGINSAVVDYSYGYDFVNNDSSPEDDNGHGTSVSYAFRNISSSEIIAVKVMNAAGGGYESDIIAGLQYCQDENADIISMSLGGGSYSGYCDSNLLAQKVNDVVDAGIVVIASTGNDGSAEKIASPACARGAIKVGASTKQDELWSNTNFNNITLLLAPGENINTVGLDGSSVTVSGTSMSSPMVAGIASLLLVQDNLQNNFTPKEIYDRLVHTGHVINVSGNDENENISNISGREFSRGFARVDALNALLNNITNNLTEGNVSLNETPLNITYEILGTPVMNSARVSAIFGGTRYFPSDIIYGECNSTNSTNRSVVYRYQWYKDGALNLSSPIFKLGSVTAGLWFSCGIRANDSRVMCWGRGDDGALGNNDNTTFYQLNPVLTYDTSPYIMVSAARNSWACGIRANDSRVLCWGVNNVGQLGVGGSNGGEYIVPTLTTDTSAYIMVSAGWTHACGIRANDSRVLCWGANAEGELGDGTLTNRNTPAVTTDTSAYIMVSAGDYTTCGIRASDSRVLCWGYGGDGSIGDGDNTNHSSPTLTNDTAPYAWISSGGNKNLGIRANDSRVLGWGRNWDYALGTYNTNTFNAIYGPTLIDTNATFIMVSAGGLHSCGIRANDSRVMCWGTNSAAELGNGSIGIAVYPTPTTDNSAYDYVAAGYSNLLNGGTTCGVRSNDSRVLCWGNSTYGQIGDGTTTWRKSPTLTSDTNPAQSANAINMTTYAPRFFANNTFLRTNVLPSPLSIGQEWILSCQSYDTANSSWVNASIMIGGARLNLWDGSDNTTVYPNVLLKFYANYTNATSASSMGTSGSCNISNNYSGSWSTQVAMAYNSTNGFYEYNTSFATTGTFYYNVSCNNSIGLGNLSKLHSFNIDYPLKIISAILNSTTSANLSTNNITVYITGNNSVTNITDWRNGGTSIAVLNMPFDTNVSNQTTGAVRDYTTYANNGTLGNGAAANSPQWTQSCKVGNCFRFNTTTYIVSPNTSSLRLSNSDFTIEAWINMSTYGSDYYITGGDTGAPALIVRYDSNTGQNVLEAASANYAPGPNSTTLQVPRTGWQHVAMTFDSHSATNNLIFYVNGSNITVSYNPSNFLAGAAMNTIGARTSGGGSGFPGWIDEVRVYKKTLTPSEINASFNAGRTGKQQESLNASSLSAGDVWTVAVTPNNRTHDGATTLSNSLTLIGNNLNTYGVVLNSTNGSNSNQNSTDDNLTLYYTTTDPAGGTPTTVIDWRLSNISWAVLNMPFDTNVSTNSSRAVKDYSSYVNNGTLGNWSVSTNVPVWNDAANCKVGGCFYFDGTNDYMVLPDSTSLSMQDSFTIMFWAKPQTDDADNVVIVKQATATGASPYDDYSMGVDATKSRWFIFINGSFCAMSPNVFTNNTWVHVAGVFEDTNDITKLYLDGVLVNTTTCTNRPNNGAFELDIGGGGAPYENFFKGYIDQMLVVNRSLSTSQIHAIYDAQASGHDADVIVKDDTNAGEVWSAALTPNNRTNDGTTMYSNNLTILNAFYVNWVNLVSTSGYNLTIENLTTSYSTTGSVTNITDWRINGSSIAVVNMPFDTNVSNTTSGAVRNYATSGANGTKAGANTPNWIQSCKVGGCFNFSATYITLGNVSATNILYNTPLTMCAWVRPRSLSAGWDTVATRGDWQYGMAFSNGQPVFWTYNVTINMTSSNVSVTTNTWYHVCGRYNGTNNTVYVNGNLTGVGMSRGMSYTNNALEIGRNSRNGAETYDGLMDEFLLFNRSLTNEQIRALYDAGMNGEPLELIVSNELYVGDNWSVALTPNNRTQDGTTVVSNNLTILPLISNGASCISDAQCSSGDCNPSPSGTSYCTAASYECSSSNGSGIDTGGATCYPTDGSIYTCSAENTIAVSNNCGTNSSIDSDSGNFPLVAGTTTDYSECTNVVNTSCSTNAYADTCPDTANLIEYYNNAASYASQAYTCASYEVAATGDVENDPTDTVNCVAGTGAGCASGAFTTNAGSSGTEGCTGTCGTGTDTCNFTEYYSIDSGDGCAGLDTCTAVTYDADTNSNTCTSCRTVSNWLIGGEGGAFGEYDTGTSTECCGDDSGEYNRTRLAHSSMDNGYVSSGADIACCSATNDCIDDATCVVTGGVSRDADGDGDNDYCNAGTWYDCNTNSECSAGYSCNSNNCVDALGPTYSNAGINQAFAGASTIFSINVSDNVALHPNGQYIFSTNNTGIWVNDSAVNFTATPQWANVTKTLNSSAGFTIGYRWYFDDNVGNINNTSIYTLVTNGIYDCATLSTANSIYTLQNDVNSTGTCFTVSAVNITLDCNSKWINYSRAGTSLTHGVYSTANNTTVRNCNIIDGNWTSPNNDRRGIIFFNLVNGKIENNFVNVSNSEAIYVINNNYTNASGNRAYSRAGPGIYGISVLSGNFTNNYATSNSSVGFAFISSSNNNRFINNTGISNTSSGFTIQSLSKNNVVINNTGQSNSSHGMYFQTGASNNTFINNTGISTTEVGLYLYQIFNNTFINQKAAGYSTGSIGIYTDEANNTLFVDCTNVTGVATDINVGTLVRNITMVNCSYTTTKESVAGTSDLTRKWYFDANVSNTTGAIQNANLSIYNVTPNMVFSQLTDAAGDITKTNLTEYVNVGGTRTYHTNHTVNVTKTNYLMNTTTYNITLSRNIFATIKLYESQQVVTGCATLATANTINVLQSNVSATGTCFIINAVNVTLDCNGNWINYSSDGTDSTYGVYSDEFNTTVKNCNIYDSNWTSAFTARRGIFFYLGNGTIENNFVNVSSSSAIYLYYSNFTKILSNNANSLTTSSTTIDSSFYNNITNNTISSNASRGLYVTNSNSNVITNNNVTSISGFGLQLSSSHNNSLVGNIGTSFANHGLLLLTSSSNNLSNNLGISNFRGLYLSTSSNYNRLVNNTGYSTNSSYGIELQASTYNILAGNNGTSNMSYGVYLYQGADFNNLTNNTGTSNSSIGILIQDSINNTLINNTGTSISSRGIRLDTSSNNTLTNNTGRSTSGSGIELYDRSNSNWLYNNNGSSNSRGIYLDLNVMYNTLINNTGTSVTSIGIQLEFNASNNTLINNKGISTSGMGMSFSNISSYNNISNNNATSNSHYGMYVYLNSNNNMFMNCTIASVSNYGMRIDSSSNNYFYNITAVSNDESAIYILNSNYTNITSSRGTSNLLRGIYLSSSTYNRLVHVTAISSDSHGLRIYSSSDHNAIINSSGTSTDSYGVYITSSTNNSFTNVTGASTYYRGFVIEGADTNFFNKISGIAINGSGIYASTSNYLVLSNSTGASNSTSGIYFTGVSGSTVTSNNGTSNTSAGIYFTGSSNNLISNNIGTSFSSAGFSVQSASNDNLIVNNKGSSNSSYGMYMQIDIANNTFISNNGTSNTSYGLLLNDISGNYFFNQTALGYLTGSYGVYFSNVNNTFFADCINVSGVAGDVYIASDVGSVNNTFLNCSYDNSKETVLGAANYLIRQWYFDANVSNTTAALANANLSIYNRTPSMVFSQLTTAGGDIARTNLTEYINLGGTKSFHTNHTVNVTLAGYNTNTTIYNITSSRNIFATIILYRDTTPPTYSNAANNQSTPGLATLFSLNVSDNLALHPNGQYIFSTNNTGVWVNDSAVNFTATPQWANVTKTLNTTGKIVIGYRWYLDDNMGNVNNTPIYTLTTANNPPPKVNLTSPINGSDPYNNRTPRFTWNAVTDLDGDAVTYTLNVSTSSTFSDSVFSKTLLAANYSDYDLANELPMAITGTQYFWKVQAHDGTVNGSYSDTWNFTLRSLVSITMITDTVNFPDMAINTSDNTTDGSPPPFVIKSSSNIYTNLTNFNVTKSLWDTQALDTKYFQMKIRTKSDGSFNETGSNTTFFNVTNATQILKRLNYTLIRNNVSIDINITVPLYEGAGVKNSSLGFYFEATS